MGNSPKTRKNFVQGVQAATTIQEIEDLSLQVDIQDGAVFCSIRNWLTNKKEDLFKEFIEKLKPVWQADFFITHHFELLVNFWTEYSFPDYGDLFFNQLKELVKNIDKAHLLEHVFEAVTGECGYYWCDLSCDILNEEQKNELVSIIKQQVRKIIDSTDVTTLAQDEDLKQFVGYLKDDEITSAYKAKIIQDKS